MKPVYILVTKDENKYIMEKHFPEGNWKEYWKPVYKYIAHEWSTIDNLDLLLMTSTTSGEFESLFSGGKLETIGNLDIFLAEQITEKFEDFL